MIYYQENLSPFAGVDYQPSEGQILANTLETAYRQSSIPNKYPRPKTIREKPMDSQLPKITASLELELYRPGIELITQRLIDRGLVYDNTPFNFGLYVATLQQSNADEICLLCTRFLASINQLRQTDPAVKKIVDGGLSSFVTQIANQDIRGNTPFIRIDLVDGKVVELGPNYVDGFATVQALSESFGIRSRCIDQLATTITQNYIDFCFQRNIIPKEKPFILFTYSRDTLLMLDELTATAEYLLATGKFYPIVEEMKPNIGKPDIVYYYGKPSMWEWDENSPKPFAQGLLDLATKRNTLILPSLNQPLGSKAALALVFDSKYQSFFINKLGLDEYNKLRQLVSPTTIIWSENDIRQLLLTITFPLIVKPSNQGSCDGVTLVNNSADFLQLGTRLGNTPEPWVVQEYQEERPLPSLIGLKSNRGSRKSEIVRLDFPFSRTVLFSAKAQCAGGFVTYNTKPIIDDGGLNVPIRIINK